MGLFRLIRLNWVFTNLELHSLGSGFGDWVGRCRSQGFGGVCADFGVLCFFEGSR